MAAREPARNARLFFAFPVDAALAVALALHARDVAAAAGGRCVPATNLHATVAFIGSVARESIDPLRAIAGRIPRADFDVTLDTLGSFRRARVAWIGASQLPQALCDAQGALCQALAAEGFRVDERPYHLHVTLARHCARALQAAQVAPLPWRIRALTLFESVTTREGPRYDALASWPQ